MVQIRVVDTRNKQDVNQFISVPFNLYKNCPQWVPPFISDVKFMLNRDKHPFFERSDGDFLIAMKGNEVVGRLMVMEHKPFNAYHQCTKMSFTLFESIDDQEVANALFEYGFEWGRKRGLNEVVGPKGMCSFDGYGILESGFDQRQMMTMSSYNYPYYPTLMENMGFEKEVDFVSCSLPMDKFILPEKIHEISRRVQERGTLKVKNFKSRRELIDYAPTIGEAYNNTFVNNWEYYPLSPAEVKYLLSQLMSVLDYRLIKIITHEDNMIGFLVAFPDISDALQRQKGRITPWGIVDLLTTMKRTKYVTLNGAGILPDFQGRGGNALLYSEMHKTIHDFGFVHAELTQVAETTKQMRKDLINVGGVEYKNHRVYHRAI